MPNVSKFQIDYIENTDFWCDPTIPFTFNELKVFEIGDHHRNTFYFFTFMYENPTIEKLTLWCQFLLGGGLITGAIVDALPLLKHIRLIGSIDDIKTMFPLLLPYIEFLERFTFHSFAEDEEIKAGSGDKWRFYRSENAKNRVTLERIEGSV